MKPIIIRAVCLLSTILAASTFSPAQARWCSIKGEAKEYKLFYPPISKAAFVQGVVMERITYTTSGQVTDIDVVQGPKLLTEFIGKQIRAWKILTDATGDAPCMSLAIFDFTIGDRQPVPAQPASPSIFRLSVHAEPLILYSMDVTTGKQVQ